MNFAENLKKLRKDNNVTQQELADYLGTGRSSIAGYETKGKHPDFSKLKMIAQYFNTTTDYLLGMQTNLQTENITIATHREEYGEDLPEDAVRAIEEYISFIKSKYKK